jgi:hypothetical protein
VLTPEQKEEWDRLYKRLKDRWLVKPPRKHGPRRHHRRPPGPRPREERRDESEGEP